MILHPMTPYTLLLPTCRPTLIFYVVTIVNIVIVNLSISIFDVLVNI